MFVVELAVDDTPERLAARPGHRQRLQGLHCAGRLVMAGPFANDSGAMLIFDVIDAAEFRALVDEDPYYRTPGVTIVRRRECSPISPGGARVTDGPAGSMHATTAGQVPGQ